MARGIFTTTNAKEFVMKAKEIVEGGTYRAKVNGKMVDVKVKRAYPCSMSGRTHYEVLNTATNRFTTFRSAQRFIRPAGTTPTAKPKRKARATSKARTGKASLQHDGQPTTSEQIAYRDYLRVCKEAGLDPRPFAAWVAHRRAHRATQATHAEAANLPKEAKPKTMTCPTCGFKTRIPGQPYCPVCEAGREPKTPAGSGTHRPADANF